jgi:hypothetical protein
MRYKKDESGLVTPQGDQCEWIELSLESVRNGSAVVLVEGWTAKSRMEDPEVPANVGRRFFDIPYTPSMTIHETCAQVLTTNVQADTGEIYDFANAIPQ